MKHCAKTDDFSALQGPATADDLPGWREQEIQFAHLHFAAKSALRAAAIPVFLSLAGASILLSPFGALGYALLSFAFLTWWLVPVAWVVGCISSTLTVGLVLLAWRTNPGTVWHQISEPETSLRSALVYTGAWAVTSACFLWALIWISIQM